MKRVIMQDVYTKDYVVITKSIRNDCFVADYLLCNKIYKVDNMGFYELVNSYKKANCRIVRCISGTVNEWGDMCDLSDLMSEKSIYDKIYIPVIIDGIEFKSIKQCCKYYGIKCNTVYIKVCRGKSENITDAIQDSIRQKKAEVGTTL